MINKADRYDWAKPGDIGKQVRIKLDDLIVDHSYQRPEVSESNTIAIAKSFNWVAFGSLVVMQRADGRICIVDGQQRWLSAKRRGDITTVPCILFQSDGIEHEARAFISLNVRRNCVPAIAKFYGYVRAGLEPEKTINNWVKSVDLKITADGKDHKGIDFPTTLIRQWKQDEQAAKLAVELQIKVQIISK